MQAFSKENKGLKEPLNPDVERNSAPLERGSGSGGNAFLAEVDTHNGLTTDQVLRLREEW